MPAPQRTTGGEGKGSGSTFRETAHLTKARGIKEMPCQGATRGLPPYVRSTKHPPEKHWTLSSQPPWPGFPYRVLQLGAMHSVLSMHAHRTVVWSASTHDSFQRLCGGQNSYGCRRAGPRLGRVQPLSSSARAVLRLALSCPSFTALNPDSPACLHRYGCFSG
jgi:hypothetical protein